MSAPFLVDPGSRASLAAALCIGVAFGFVLERAGMGNAPKLASQFYLRDNTVIKVMFSALVTTMLGVFWLGRIGVLDTTAVYVPDTFLLPQATGGLIFGLGFVIGGLCPGTSCVAAAAGRIDGLGVMFGMLIGSLLSGLGVARVTAFYNATYRGVFTLPAALHVSAGVATALVTLGGLGMFVLITRYEMRRGASE